MSVFFLYFYLVPWQSRQDTLGAYYFPQSMSAKEFVFSMLQIDESVKETAPRQTKDKLAVEKQAENITASPQKTKKKTNKEAATLEDDTASLGHLKYFANNTRKKHQVVTAKKIVWSLIDGTSVLLKKCIPTDDILHVWQQNELDQLVPDHDLNSFILHLSSCQLLDNIHVLLGGKGPDWIPLNNTAYPQPRRITWSVLISECTGTCQLDSAIGPLKQLFSMPQTYRQISDLTTRPMPMSIFLLGVKIWHSCYSHLSAISRACPPNGCQLLLYYTDFGEEGGRMGYHKDVGFKTNTSQIRGSSVMILSVMHSMLFEFLKLEEDTGKYKRHPKKHYVSDPDLQFVFEHEDVLILDPTDDEKYVHGVTFNRIERKPHDYRAAFVFRWLSKPDYYYTDSDGQYKIYNPEDLSQKAKTRSRGRPRKEDPSIATFVPKKRKGTANPSLETERAKAKLTVADAVQKQQKQACVQDKPETATVEVTATIANVQYDVRYGSIQYEEEVTSWDGFMDSSSDEELKQKGMYVLPGPALINIYLMMKKKITKNKTRNHMQFS